jgi:hypothetical protein
VQGQNTFKKDAQLQAVDAVLCGGQPGGQGGKRAQGEQELGGGSVSQRWRSTPDMPQSGEEETEGDGLAADLMR